jgi:hypothetical protein
MVACPFTSPARGPMVAVGPETRSMRMESTTVRTLPYRSIAATVTPYGEPGVASDGVPLRK